MKNAETLTVDSCVVLKDDESSSKPRRHIVEFYNEDQKLIRSLCKFIARGLIKNEGAIIIATEAHRKDFEKALAESAFSVPDLKIKGQLVLLDAAETLSIFMDGTMPDPHLFRHTINSVLDKMETKFPVIRAYGEMVGLLLKEGNSEGTIALEKLWNDLGKERSFSLLCGYSTELFKNAKDGVHFDHVCSEHSHVLPADSDGEEGLGDDHYRTIAILQQREKALQQELSERIKIEAELTRKQSDLNDFFENAVMGLHWVGPDGTILKANKAELKMLGYEESEFVGHKITEFHADQDVIKDILNRLLRNEVLSDFPARLKAKDGSIKHVLISSNAYVIDGVFAHTRCFTRDISKNIETEKALYYSEVLKQVILESTDDCIKVLDKDGIIKFINEGGIKKLGLSSADGIRGVSWFSFWDGENLSKAKHYFQEAFSGKSVQFLSETRLSEESEHSYWNIVIAPIRNAAGLVTQVLVTSRDVSEIANIQREETKKLERFQEELKIALEKMRQASNAKSEFLVNMSHEIRTPMNSILGFSELLLNTELSKEERLSYLQTVKRNGDQLLSLIDDILDLSKFESGKIETDKVSFSVKDLLADLTESLKPMAEKKSIELITEFTSNMPESIVSDPLRFRQILLNLVGNAIKFSSGGCVYVRSNCHILNGAKMLTLDIEDNGIGILEKDQANLFKPFVQADSSIARKFGGTGLGLALSKRLAEALGGDVVLKSSFPGKGSIFSFTMTVHNEQKAESRSQTATVVEDISSISHPLNSRLKNRKILLAEDSPDNETLVKIFLKSEGAEVFVARNGLEAVEMASAGNYDLILMDIQMPIMDGLEATRRLRASGFKRPILALTAHALREEIEKSVAAGCNVHLTKPVKRKDLLDGIIKILH